MTQTARWRARPDETGSYNDDDFIRNFQPDAMERSQRIIVEGTLIDSFASEERPGEQISGEEQRQRFRAALNAATAAKAGYDVARREERAQLAQVRERLWIDPQEGPRYLFPWHDTIQLVQVVVFDEELQNARNAWARAINEFTLQSDFQFTSELLAALRAEQTPEALRQAHNLPAGSAERIAAQIASSHADARAAAILAVQPERPERRVPPVLSRPLPHAVQPERPERPERAVPPILCRPLPRAFPVPRANYSGIGQTLQL